MAKYRSDLRWINARFDGSCVRCRCVIRRGDKAFYYPQERSLYCERENCGEAASRDSRTELELEEVRWLLTRSC